MRARLHGGDLIEDVTPRGAAVRGLIGASEK
jgi:hypothetical protein